MTISRGLPAREPNELLSFLVEPPLEAGGTPSAVCRTGRTGERTPPPGSPGTILIVEDNPDARDSLADLLDDVGYQVACAANGREALTCIGRDRSPALILLDLQMPIMDGWTFLDHLQENPSLAAIPVVVLSAMVEDERDIRFPVAAALTKPLRIEELTTLVVRFCGLPTPH